MYATFWITNIILIHIIVITPSELEKFKQYLNLYPIHKQILYINHKLDSLENFKFRVGSIDRVNKRFSKIKYLKTLRNKILKDNTRIINFIYILLICFSHFKYQNKITWAGTYFFNNNL